MRIAIGLFAFIEVYTIGKRYRVNAGPINYANVKHALNAEAGKAV